MTLREAFALLLLYAVVKLTLVATIGLAIMGLVKGGEWLLTQSWMVGVLTAAIILFVPYLLFRKSTPMFGAFGIANYFREDGVDNHGHRFRRWRS